MQSQQAQARGLVLTPYDVSLPHPHVALVETLLEVICIGTVPSLKEAAKHDKGICETP